MGILLMLFSPLEAQQTLVEQGVSESGDAYAASIQFRGIDTDVVYFDPTLPPPSLETDQSLEPHDVERRDNIAPEISVTGGRNIVFVISVLILAGVLYLFVAFGGGLPASLARQPDEGESGSDAAPSGEDIGATVTIGLQSILNMADRRDALVALCKALLARAVAAEGVLLQKSWTDREMLRRVPQDHAHRAALRALVHDSERAQFGGRDVSEETFRDHVDRLRPLLTEAGT